MVNRFSEVATVRTRQEDIETLKLMKECGAKYIQKYVRTIEEDSALYEIAGYDSREYLCATYKIEPRDKEKHEIFRKLEYTLSADICPRYMIDDLLNNVTQIDLLENS